MAGTAWSVFAPNTKIKSSEFNENFDWLEGNIVPMSGGAMTDSAYDLGTTINKWNTVYSNNLVAINGITLGTATTASPYGFIYASGTVQMNVNGSPLYIARATSHTFSVQSSTSYQTIFEVNLNGVSFNKTPNGLVIDRGSDSGYDYTTGSFTFDNTWRDLTLSTIVPENVKYVLLRCLMRHNAVNNVALEFRKNGTTAVTNTGKVYSQVLTYTVAQDIWVGCDSNRVIEYLAPTGTVCFLTVGGWIF